MTGSRGKRLAGLLCAAICLIAAADARPQSGETDWTVGGHLKYRLVAGWYPDNSIFRSVLGSDSMDNSLETKPCVISTLPLADTDDFFARPGRYGAHNIYENTPGATPAGREAAPPETAAPGL